MTEASGLSLGSPVWEIQHRHTISDLVMPPTKFEGALIVDIDGTLTAPGKKYAIEPEAVSALADFLEGGGRIVFCTGATEGRIERTVLVPLFNEIESRDRRYDGRKFFSNVFVMPENGSAVLIFKDFISVENEVRFIWRRVHELHVPHKKELRELIETMLVPRYSGSKVWGDSKADLAPRDYILSLTGLEEGSPSEVISQIKALVTRPENLPEKFRDLDWSMISMKAARTTVDFVHTRSGKEFSIFELLNDFAEFKGPILGLGDLGDEFAAIVPTINVNKFKPNEFRVRQMPSMDICGGWKLLKPASYTVLGKGSKAVVRDLSSDKAVEVLRTAGGAIIYAQELEKPDYGVVLSPVKDESFGRPVAILPLKRCGLDNTGLSGFEIDDAGRGSAWIIRYLLRSGYFSPVNHCHAHSDLK